MAQAIRIPPIEGRSESFYQQKTLGQIKDDAYPGPLACPGLSPGQAAEDVVTSQISELKSLVSGLLLSQQVLIEMLVRNDAIGYHQARAALDDALGILRKSPSAPLAALRPLERALGLLDELHRPLGVGERPRAVDWRAELQRIQGD